MLSPSTQMHNFQGESSPAAKTCIIYRTTVVLQQKLRIRHEKLCICQFVMENTTYMTQSKTLTETLSLTQTH